MANRSDGESQRLRIAVMRKLPKAEEQHATYPSGPRHFFKEFMPMHRGKVPKEAFTSACLGGIQSGLSWSFSLKDVRRKRLRGQGVNMFQS